MILFSFFFCCSSIIKLSIQLTILIMSPSLRLLTAFLLSVISSLVPLHHIAQLYLFMLALVYSMNILMRCSCWETFFYFIFFHGALNLYSWPWMHILRDVMMEESCSTQRSWGRNNICCVCISSDELVLQAKDDTLTQMKENIYIWSVCDSLCSFWLSGLTLDADLT